MSVAQQYTMPNISYEKTVTILSGQTVSSTVNIGGMSFVGIILPAQFTGTVLTMQMSTGENDPTFRAVTDFDGTPVTLTVSANKYVKMDPANFAGLFNVQFISNAAGGEAADRTIIICARPV